VMFKDKPLSYYLLKMEAEGNTPQTPPEDDVQHCSAAASPKALTTVAAGLNRLMKIKTIHLLDDEELLPNVVMDYYWEKLLKKDCSESEDWG
ncbi:putative ankyrin repeat domain-containing protein 31, partial [Lates japonicus]